MTDKGEMDGTFEAYTAFLTFCGSSGGAIEFRKSIVFLQNSIINLVRLGPRKDL